MNPLAFVGTSSERKVNLGTDFVEQVEANGRVLPKGQELVEAFHQKSNPPRLE